MVGVATGLARRLHPFVYSITPFAVLRPYEFIRNGPIQHRLRCASSASAAPGIRDQWVEPLWPGRYRRHARQRASQSSRRRRRQARGCGGDLEPARPIYYRLAKMTRRRAGSGGRFDWEGATSQQGSDLLMIAMGSVATEAAAAAQNWPPRVSCSLVIVASVTPRRLMNWPDCWRGIPWRSPWSALSRRRGRLAGGGGDCRAGLRCHLCAVALAHSRTALPAASLTCINSMDSRLRSWLRRR